MKGLSKIGMVLAAAAIAYAIAKLYDGSAKLAGKPLHILPTDSPGILSGPYLKIGDPNTLRFRVSDLGIGAAFQMAENGAILYSSFGGQLLTEDATDKDGFPRKKLILGKPSMVLKKQFAVAVQLDPTVLQLLENGSVLTKDANGANRFFVDGNPVLQNIDQKYLNSYPSVLENTGQGTGVSAEGVYFKDSFDNKLVFSDWKGATKDVRKTSSFASFFGSSTLLGTFAKLNMRDTRSISRIKAGAEETYDLGFDIVYTPVLPCLDSCYLSGPEQGQQFRPWKLVNNKFVRQAVPEGCYSATARKAGSLRFCVLNAIWYDEEAARTYGYPVDRKDFYVDADIAYDLSEILLKAGIVDESSKHFYELKGVSASGDILVDASLGSFKHVFLLERRP